MAKRNAAVESAVDTDAGELVTDETTLAKLTAEVRALALEEGEKLGLEKGAKAERERILGIETVAMPGHEKLIATLKADGRTSPAEAAVKQAMVEKETRVSRLDALKADGKTGVDPAPTTTGEIRTVVDDSKLPLEDRCKAQWEKDESLRAQYEGLGGFEAYLAGEKAFARGLARVRSTPNAA